MVVAAWIGGINAIRQTREAARCVATLDRLRMGQSQYSVKTEEARCLACRDRLKQIALSLQSYEAANKSLPPAYLCDKAGKPVLSWRVVTAQYVYREMFSKSLGRRPTLEFV